MLIERFMLWWVVTQLTEFIETIVNSIRGWALEVC